MSPGRRACGSWSLVPAAVGAGRGDPGRGWGRELQRPSGRSQACWTPAGPGLCFLLQIWPGCLATPGPPSRGTRAAGLSALGCDVYWGGWGRVARKAAPLRSLSLSSCPARPGPEPRVAARGPWPSVGLGFPSAGSAAPVFWVAALGLVCVSARVSRAWGLAGLGGAVWDPFSAAAVPMVHAWLASFPPASVGVSGWRLTTEDCSLVGTAVFISFPLFLSSAPLVLAEKPKPQLGRVVLQDLLLEAARLPVQCSDVMGLGGSRW